MARCNHDGVVAWSETEEFETLRLDTSDYGSELLVRLRFRADENVDRTCGAPLKILRFFVLAAAHHDMFGGIWCSEGLRNEGVVANEQMATYWGASDTAGDSTAWHTVAYYFNQSTGAIRVWHDGVLARDEAPAPGFGETRWEPLYPVSTRGDAHDALNHVYFDEVEVFSDSTSGEPAAGEPLDGTVEML